MKIVFMGTPDFAVASLEKIIEAGIDVVGVITAPDRPAGRGQKLASSAVKIAAQKHHLKILQPEKLKDEQFLHELKSLQADLFVVVAFRMLPEIVWKMPAKGTINLHGSLLPQYRGAAPINWAVINGEKETGVTTFFIQHEIDTGNILLQKKFSIEENDTAGIVHDKMMQIGADLLVETIKKIANNDITDHPQTNFMDGELKHAPKIFRDTCKIDWNKSTDEIHNLIRGLSPYPAAFTNLKFPDNNFEGFKIYTAHKTGKPKEKAPGEIETDNKSFLQVATGDGMLELTQVQLPGKKRMQIDDLLRGFKFPEGAKFE